MAIANPNNYIIKFAETKDLFNKNIFNLLFKRQYNAFLGR